ncbi:GbsR/MarR family transcriptional regulator [Ignatzschineria sp. LJL83]
MDCDNKLTPKELEFILHWGEMGSRWGVNRTVAQIHALLFIQGEPMSAEAVCETLGIARSNSSNSIKELERLGLVKRLHVLNDRKDYFETSGDVWELLKIIAKERIEQELKPTEIMLTNLMNDPEFKNERKVFQERTKESAELLHSLIKVSDQMLGFSAKGLKRLFKTSSGLMKFILGARKEES